jgi:hypothetical protein
LRKIVAIFVFLGVWLQAFHQLVIVAQYYANKDYIARNLCENRDKPKMHCDGKCCLKKKLAKEGKDQAPSPRNQRSDEAINLFYSDTRLNIAAVFPYRSPVKYFSYNDLAISRFHRSIFHPPGRLMFA